MSNVEMRFYLGVMSGTSADGVDIALLGLKGQHLNTLAYDDGGLFSLPYSPELTQRIFALQQGQPVALKQLLTLEHELSQLWAQAIMDALQQFNKTPQDISAIGLHGQTIFHQPSLATWQLGNAAWVAQQTGIKTIAQFRQADMAVGGQGAPLVCFADAALFATEQELRHALCCFQNIGGIANVTAVFPQAWHQSPIAFDSGPGNNLLDWAANTYLQQAYDQNGDTARSGQLSQPFLQLLQQHPYYQQCPPKSTGRDVFGPMYHQHLSENITQLQLEPADILNTLTELSAWHMAEAYRHWIQPLKIRTAHTRFIVSGGGARNGFLLERLQAQLTHDLTDDLTLETAEAMGINSQAKEALAFALLAWAHEHGIAANIPSCTGASRAVVLGAAWPV